MTTEKKTVGLIALERLVDTVATGSSTVDDMTISEVVRLVDILDGHCVADLGGRAAEGMNATVRVALAARAFLAGRIDRAAFARTVDELDAWEAKL